MLRKPLLFSFCLYVFTGFSQGYRPVGARSAALASTSVCLADAWAFYHNPGALARVPSATGGVYYEARFLAKELQTQAIVAAVPLAKGVLSAGGQFYGYEQFRHTRAGIGYSMALAEKIAAGVQANLQQLRLGSNYGSATNATFEAGILATVSERWKFGVSAMNIGRQRIHPLPDERFTTALRLGSQYAPSKKVLVLLEVEKQVLFPVSFKGALEYRPAEAFALRFGAHSAPTEIAFGIGYRRQGFHLDAGSQYHPVLGWTPHAGLTYQFVRHETH